MPTTDLLKTFGLSRNPFTDRTAEKSFLDPLSLYIHSDLRAFRPNETTYVFFGKRGSGKTTIRLQMEAAYKEYNDEAVASGRSNGHFVVNLARPGHLTFCLRTFQEHVGATLDNWDASFSEEWVTADVVDCILSYAATEIVKKLTSTKEDGRKMMEVLRGDAKGARQMLLLAHLYARTDSEGLASLRSALLKPKYTAVQVSIAAVAATTVAAGAVATARDQDVTDALMSPVLATWDYASTLVPVLDRYPKLSLATAGLLTTGCVAYYYKWLRARSLDRAASIQRNIRIIRSQPTPLLASLLNALFPLADTAETIRQLCIGVSAHQKLELLQSLLVLLGYESLAVFGDCFDEVTLLDPVRFPGAIKAFAREICRNDVLNFGRLHFFFPDSRLALDLNTDKTLKEARFDRHFVRDLTWSRHQLEELAERRFRAAQQQLQAEAGLVGQVDLGSEFESTSFADLFKKVRGEDFSSYISKLHTPRELMIMMTEMFARIEAHPDGGLTSQDMEIAVTKALEQAV